MKSDNGYFKQICKSVGHRSLTNVNRETNVYSNWKTPNTQSDDDELYYIINCKLPK